MSEETKERLILEEGKKYRVIAAGCSLKNTVSIGPNCWTDDKHGLNVGDEVEFTGHKNCWGSDPIPVPHFVHEGYAGEFWPTDWTQPKAGTLEEATCQG